MEKLEWKVCFWVTEYTLALSLELDLEAHYMRRKEVKFRNKTHRDASEFF